MASCFLPPAVIGIVGGGQLGRMLALMALDWGYRVYVYCQHPDEPAVAVAHRAFLHAFTDTEALTAFASVCDVVTCEFEHIEETGLRLLQAQTLLRPQADVFLCTQDRIKEKRFIESCGIPVAPWQPVHSQQTLEATIDAVGLPCLVKTARLGYDGKGQYLIRRRSDQEAGRSLLQTGACVVESQIDFRCELSVIVSRSSQGEVFCYDVSENRHENGILRSSQVPCLASKAVMAQAQTIAKTLAHQLDVVGLLAVELFLTEDDTLYVNELAPRAHNSGHWTMDGCLCSQFEQWLRMICGLPSGAIRRLYDVEMRNVLGDAVVDFRTAIEEPQMRVHLYGKKQARQGRKMGHVNVLGKRLETNG